LGGRFSPGLPLGLGSQPQANSDLAAVLYRGEPDEMRRVIESSAELAPENEMPLLTANGRFHGR
jgi:hypothetical protein